MTPHTPSSKPSPDGPVASREITKSPNHQITKSLTVQPLLERVLEPAVHQRRSLRAAIAQGVVWFAAAAAIAAFWLAGADPGGLLWAIAALALAASFVSTTVARRWTPDYRRIARQVEQLHPAFNSLLLTAVEQQPDAQTGQFSYLQKRVLNEAIEAGRARPWIADISRWHTQGARLFALAGVAAFALMWHGTAERTSREHRAGAASSGAVEISPGDAVLERGSGLVVLARFPGEMPAAATLVIEGEASAPQLFPLTRNLADPVFGGGLPEVQLPFKYRVQWGEETSPTFTVSVFEHPRLEQADVRVKSPDYTRLPEKKFADTRRVTAVEGSRLALEFKLNKPVRAARLVGADGTELPLAVEPGKPMATLADWTPAASQAWELRLEDADGRSNKLPASLVVELSANRRPELKFLTPKGDQRVTALEEVSLSGEAWDDFGLQRWGLSYTVAGQPPQEIVLAENTAADTKVAGAHLLKLEDLKVKSDQLISWHLWAEDLGPDSQPRRTTTDIFFAEVRPFEEIFRPGQDGQEGGQPGGGSPATKLADLQKQIIAATWNLQRSLGTPAADAKYRKDLPTVQEAQDAAIAQAAAMRAKVDDKPRMAALVDAVSAAMATAATHLQSAGDEPSKLSEALAAEQGAYNALLKLAAHEYQITRSKKGQGGESSGERNQRQLDQLELKEEKNRYETKREAAPPAGAAQGEQLAALNRLKELARRQEGINEKLKELQAALAAAETGEKKEELRRELKRLREDEQEMLADMDELKQQMEETPNASQFADERKKLEQTRERAQQASEAMEKGETGQAMAAGTRAQQELQQLRDDFRKKTSGQFRDEMRDMRSDARDLASQQEALAEALKPTGETPPSERPSLAGNSDREKLGERFAEQGSKLDKLRADMQRVSEQAEAEPLLAKELYETLRKSALAGTEETLERAGSLAGKGFPEHARKFQEKVQGELNDLKSGVERAAESVLGDEGEALRLASAEVEALQQQLTPPGGEAPSSRKGVPPVGPAGVSPAASPGEGGAEQSRSSTGVPPAEQSETQSSPGKPTSPGNQPTPPQPSPGSRLRDLADAPSGAGGEGSRNNGEGIDRPEGPLTGGNFIQWSDRLRNVEEMIENPELRTEAARIREAAKSMRAEFKRHGAEPNWDLVRTKISAPMAELRNRIQEELVRRSGQDAMVPIDRDPVPTQYAEQVRRYYELLGRTEKR